MAVTSEGLAQAAIEISRESATVSEMLAKLSSMLKESLGAEEAVTKDVYQMKGELSQAEEAALNTKMPYLDNRLSSYSGFVDLINYFSAGFRSCLMIPIATEQNNFGIITLLSRKEECFRKGSVETLAPIARMLSYELDSRLERERSLSMARYFDAAFEGVMPQFIIEKSGRIVKANKSAMNMLGTVQKDIAGSVLGDFFYITPDIAESIKDSRTAEIKDLKSGRDYRLSPKKINDSLVHLLLSDTTELRNLEDRAGVIAMSQAEVFMLLDKNMRITWVGGDMALLKAGEANFTDRMLQGFVKDREGIGIESRIRNMRDEPFREQVRLALDNGIEIDVNMAIARRQGGYAAVISRNMERFIENMRNEVSDLVALSHEFVIVIDDEGFVRGSNKSAERLLKYGSGDLDGVPISSLFADSESKDRMNSAMDMAKGRDTLTDLFVSLSTKDGEQVRLTQNIKTLRDADNKVTGYILIGKELNTKMAMEEMRSQLELRTKQAEKMKQESDLKTQFIFNVSHELKTPITNINGYARLLLSGSFGELSAEQLESVRTIITEDDRLMQLIQQILDVAKLEAGKIKLDWQEVDLNSIRDNPSIKSLEEMVKAKGLGYDFIIDYNVPRIEADPNRLIQVFVNLIVNAYKFTDKGGITIKATRKGKGSVRIEVSDTGIGISPDDRAKLFKRFYQLQKRGLTKQEGSGTGLGLSIVKEIVSLHGGRVGVGSETAVGKGSVFWFSLPVHRKIKKERKSEEAKSDAD